MLRYLPVASPRQHARRELQAPSTDESPGNRWLRRWRHVCSSWGAGDWFDADQPLRHRAGSSQQVSPARSNVQSPGQRRQHLDRTASPKRVRDLFFPGTKGATARHAGGIRQGRCTVRNTYGCHGWVFGAPPPLIARRLQLKQPSPAWRREPRRARSGDDVRLMLGRQFWRSSATRAGRKGRLAGLDRWSRITVRRGGRAARSSTCSTGAAVATWQSASAIPRSPAPERPRGERCTKWRRAFAFALAAQGGAARPRPSVSSPPRCCARRHLPVRWRRTASAWAVAQCC